MEPIYYLYFVPVILWIVLLFTLPPTIRRQKTKFLLWKICNRGVSCDRSVFDKIYVVTSNKKYIEVAFSEASLFLIQQNKMLEIPFEKLILIKHKNGVYTFKLPDDKIAHTKSFLLQTDDLDFYDTLECSSKLVSTPESKFSWSNFIRRSNGRFIILGISYAVILAFFTIFRSFLPFFITSIIFGIGLLIFIVAHYIQSSPSSDNCTAEEILEKRERIKLFYSKVIAICLAIAVVLTLLITLFPSNNNSGDCGHASCKANGPFYCMGKNNTCKNKTYCAYDLYCDECD